MNRRGRLRTGCVIMAVCAYMCSCMDRAPKGDHPLPPAYPRAATYEPVYQPIDSLPVNWEANSSCHTTADYGNGRAIFIDTDYAAYRAKLMLTLTPVTDSISRIATIDNRIERMSLNTGGAESSLSTFKTPAGYEARILETPVSSPTPVQFVASGDKWVISGALLLASSPTSADSIAPVVETVRRDIIHALNCLR